MYTKDAEKKPDGDFKSWEEVTEALGHGKVGG